MEHAKYIPREKCSLCNRKVNHLDIVCKCGTKFCMVHQMPEKHNCTFDFKTFDRNRLAKTLQS